jgi:hypothetical protein
MASMLAKFYSPDVYLWGQLKTLVNAAPIENEQALHHHIVDVC